MKQVSHGVFAGAALAILLLGCQAHEAPLEMTSHTAALPGMSLDPSVPDASTVFAAQDAADKAEATRAATAMQQAAPVGKKMTPEEEAKAMPLAGQVNDHSTPGARKN